MIAIIHYNKLLPARDATSIRAMNTNLRKMMYSTTVYMEMQTNV